MKVFYHRRESKDVRTEGLHRVVNENAIQLGQSRNKLVVRPGEDGARKYVKGQ